MPADRGAHAARQAELLRALLRDGDFPEGVDPEPASATALALRRKRARAVVKTWPALAHALGTELEALFEAYARRSTAPSTSGGLHDGLRFARTLPAGTQLTDAARAELLHHRARAARAVFLGAARQRGALLVVVRLPLAGARSTRMRLGGVSF